MTDFGLAREVVELPVKDTGRKLSLVGSAFWMAPEMLRGELYDRKVTVLFAVPPVVVSQHNSTESTAALTCDVIHNGY